MTEAADAIAALKAKLTALADASDSFAALAQASKVATDSFVALAGAKYVHVSMNADWDPKDHPRNPHTGEFMKTLGGYIFGKAKKAEFKSLVSGSNKKIELDLAPGDVAFQTPQKNVLVSHADGSYTLHNVVSGKVTKVPEGSHSNIAAWSEQGKLEKIAENPGLKVDAGSKKEAADKLEHPDAYLGEATGSGSVQITDPPALKTGKTAHTAKQYADYQSENLGKTLFKDKNGKEVTSGSWIDVDGKPLLVHASPTGKGKISVYRWVKTKQQASNLVKEDFLSPGDIVKKAFAIDDPTGSPYGIDINEQSTKTTKVKVGSLMSQAVVGTVPNTSTFHKKFVEESIGNEILDGDDKPVVAGKSNLILNSGDWVEIEGKPFRVFQSPNLGNVALAKWVSTKQQPSNNTYDFPASVLSEAYKVEDPTGKDYEPVVTTSDGKFTITIEDGEDFGDLPSEEEALEYLKSKLVEADPDTYEETQIDDDAPLADWEKELLGIPIEGPVTAASVPGAPVGTKVVLTYPLGSKTSYKKLEENKWQASSIVVPDVSIQNAFEVLKNQPGSTIEWTEPGKETVTLNSEPAPEKEPEDLTPQAYTIQEDTNLSIQPLGTFLEVNAGGGYWHKTLAGWDSYAADGMKITFGATLNGKDDFGPIDQVIVAPPGSYLATKIAETLNTEAEEVSVWFSGQPWTLKNNEWTAPDGSVADADVASGLLDKAAEAQATHNAILAMVKGDTLHVDYFDSLEGQTYIYELNDNGGLFNPAVGEAYVAQKEVFAGYSTNPAFQKQATFKVQKSGQESVYPTKLEITGDLIDQIDGANPGDTLTWEYHALSTDVLTKNEDGKWYYPDGSFQETAALLSEVMKFGPDAKAITIKSGDDSSSAAPATENHNVFVHPISGVSFDLNPGDKVWKHKKTEGNFIIETSDPNTPINFFFSNGKLGVPKATQKSLDKNYEIVDVWPGKKDGQTHDESGAEVQTSTPIVATEEHIKYAIPGDKIQLTGVGFSETLTYTKQPEGNWVNQHDWAMLPEMIQHHIVTNSSTVTFVPNNTVLSAPNPNEPPTAPWGGPEAIGNNPEAYKKPAKKSKKKEALPTTYVLPSGTEINLKPGDTLVKVDSPSGNETYYVHVTPSKNEYNAVYNGAGAVSPQYTFQKWSLAKAKSYIKTYNGEILAEKPTIKIEQDFSDYATYSESYLLTEDSSYPLHYASQLIQEVFSNELHQLVPVSWGGIGWKDTPLGKPWGELSPDDQMSLLAQFSTPAGRMYATLDAALTKHENLDKSEKAKITKFKNAAALIHRFANAAQQIADPDTTWDDETFESEISLLTAKAAQGGVALPSPFGDKFPASSYAQALNDANIQRHFKKQLADLSFDPYTATTEDYDTYAKSKGFDYLAALTPDMQKNWVLADLGDPSVNKAAALAAASKVKTKVVIAGISASLTKGMPPAPKFEAAKGLWEKAHMKQSYTWKDANGQPNSIKNIGNDEWEFSVPGSTITVNDAVVQTAVNGTFANENFTDFTESDDFAYGNDDAASLIQKMSEKHGYPITSMYAGSHSDLAAAEGAKGTFKSNAALRRWFVYKAIGDQLGQYSMESGNSPELDHSNHIGSPSTTTGALAWKVLAGQILSIPDGDKFIENGMVTSNFRTGIEAAFSVLGNGLLNTSQWIKDHPADILRAALESGAPGSGDKPVAVKPLTVDQATWDFVRFLTPNTDLADLYGTNTTLSNMTDQELTSSLVGSSTAKDHGLHSLYISSVPTYLKRLAVWASANSNDEYRIAVLKSITARAKAGEFLSSETPVWISPDGATYPISPGASVFKSENNDSFLVTGPPLPNGALSTDAFVFSTGKVAPASSWMAQSPTSHGYNKVFTMPNPVQWDQAKKDNPDLDQNYWDEVLKIESGVHSLFSSNLFGSVLTAELKSNAALQTDYPHLFANSKNLPENIRQAIHGALKKKAAGGSALLDVLEYKTLKGHYASMQSKGLFDLSKPWVKPLSLGQMSEKDIDQYWSITAKQEYINSFGLSDFGQIAPHLSSLLEPVVAGASTAPSWTNTPDWKNLTLTPTGKKLGGMHTKYHLVDQNGDEWMQKTFESDKSMAPYRIEAEVGALQIGNLYGFRGPVAGAVYLNGSHEKNVHPSKGTYSYLQYLKGGPGTTDLVGHGPNDLTLKQLQQAMEEHVLDWITANHDTHQQNLRFDDDGNIFGIDKGQAFKHFPNDQLSIGYLPPENGEAVWYDKFYKGIQNGSIDKERADEVVKHVLRRAQKVSKDKDDEYRELLSKALDKRPVWPSQYTTKDKFIDALVERKHNTFDKFVEFYKDVYKSSPYEFDIDTENLVPPMLNAHTHISVSQDLAVDVKKSGNHGKSLFFNSAEIEDSHFLLFTGKEKNGTTTLLGETKVRANGDKQMLAWLKKQTIEDQSHSYQSQSYAPVISNEYEEMPKNAEFFNAMVQYSKTVSSHNASGDHQYNQGTVQAAEAQYNEIVSLLESVKKWEAASALTNPAPFEAKASGIVLHTMEQHEAWKQMLETYKGYYEKVKQHEGKDTKVSPHFTQFVYTPTDAAKAEYKGLPLSPSASPAGFQIKDHNGNVWEKQADGSWKALTKKAVTDDFNFQSNWFTQITAVSKEEAEKEAKKAAEESVTVNIGTKQVKVTRKKNMVRTGKYNIDSGELVMNEDFTSQYYGTTLAGHMYEIDFGDVRIMYHAHEPDTKPTDLGRLVFEKRNWDGDSSTMDEIFDVLRQIGLTLDPADEASMELFYWRQLTGVLGDRKSKTTPKWKKVIDTTKQGTTEGMAVADELALYRAAWTEAIGEEKVKNANWLPQFSSPRLFAQDKDEEGTFTSGRPYWMRPDMTAAEARAQNIAPATHSIVYGGNANNFYKIAMSGGLFSAEEKWRFFGATNAVDGTSKFSNGTLGGVSPESDYNQHGSSAQVYTYAAGSVKNTGNVYLHPKTLFRTTNYVAASDSYGDINKKLSSPWEISEINDKNNYELMFKNMLSVLDDMAMIEFATAEVRNAAIKEYKDRGITMIHGFPIEEIFVVEGNVSTSQRKKIYDKLWNDLITEQDEWAKEHGNV